MTRFRLSRQAKADLEAIAAYIGDRNPSAAVQELRKLHEKFAVLGKNPLMGELRQELPKSPRSFTAGNHVILYKQAISGIEVARVVHASRDIGTILRENEP
jgi:toxin ParE1/3/4